jgi:hypothetical protein
VNFSQYRKTLKLETIGVKSIPIDKIKCQYNPDMYKHWVKVCGDSFSIESGPYWEYLNYRKTNKYKQLFKLYGRNELWILNNILKFNQLLESVRKDGFDESKGLPVVLETPVVKNKYNKGLEVWEGHRRLSICKYLFIEQRVKLCQII